ncbi:MAG TPA: DUF6089 family protein [Bacteroidales bacterium]|jgi:hypothetical protein|nr:hypothetical protein [Bacteroidales bacterium]OQB61934.1 MAG: hypothetical protein BWX96_01590 [Bacteroidetes bacterium ADurb.Bin145]HOU01902.1 DUF6089 family protein [Bacteroidales bacterium]HQG63805.1 DUF6089 family protein [Bacteroidales bacterium]HQK67324.1 DUF6089 family protein [Bacteroidales bacterium]
MKRIPWIFFFIIVYLTAAGQPSADYGIFGGVSSYLGDINPGRLLYSPMPAGGIFYRYNLHPRQALRANLFYGGIRASDLDFNNSFQQNRNESFSGSIGEFAVQFEFNFLPYTTQGKLWDFTPYIAAGGAIAFFNAEYQSFEPVIPFSIGFKANIHKNMGLEVEYGFRKSFYDNFDGLNDKIAPADYGWIHNNDWYSLIGVAFTWKIYSKMTGCPAYNDVDGKRKR